ncbi:hypothetical protein BOTBODRAFT_621261, partial [Botryobasidium botryosum FD-172 SS1]
QAPNPLLQISTGAIGTIGLPLSEPEAKRIVAQVTAAGSLASESEQAAMDQDIDTGGPCEIDASDVHFGNPLWEPFVAEVAKSACDTIGVDCTVGAPKVEPHKLCLYEPGSWFTTSDSTAKADGMFGTITILLPSAFAGGEIFLSHAERPAAIDFSAGSLSTTSVLSYYADVTQEIEPITSGYCLALPYNLIHATNSPQPSLHIYDIAMQKLWDVLLAWKQSIEQTPQKIAYLLQKRPSKEALYQGSLQDADAHKAAALGKVATEAGFHVGLAIMECRLSGTAKHLGSNRRGRRWPDHS